MQWLGLNTRSGSTCSEMPSKPSDRSNSWPQQNSLTPRTTGRAARHRTCSKVKQFASVLLTHQAAWGSSFVASSTLVGRGRRRIHVALAQQRLAERVGFLRAQSAFAAPHRDVKNAWAVQPGSTARSAASCAQESHGVTLDLGARQSRMSQANWLSLLSEDPGLRHSILSPFRRTSLCDTRPHFLSSNRGSIQCPSCRTSRSTIPG